MQFIRNSQLLYKLLLVDGIGRSGKVMLAQILTGFDTVEKQEYNEFLEYIPLAYKYKKISEDIAESILRTQMDAELYNSMIGRNINTRPNDYTGLNKYHSPQKYLKRQSSLDGTEIKQRVVDEKPIYLNWCHDLIYKSEIIFKSFGDKLTLIYLNRRPIDIIYEWDKKNFGNRIASDPTDLTYLLKYKDTEVPESSIGWEDCYLYMDPLERIIKIIHSSMKRNLESITKLSDKKNLIIINFEDLVTNPYIFLNYFAEYINLEIREDINKILIEENCPRVLSIDELETRRANIKANISYSCNQYLDEMEEMYTKISSFSNLQK